MIAKILRSGIAEDIVFPATTELIDCLDTADFMLQHIEVKDHILDDSRYDYIFTVEDVNRLVLEGVPFRDAYRQVGMAVQKGEYKPTREVHHTHLGSIGNPANDRVAEKMDKLMEGFN